MSLFRRSSFLLCLLAIHFFLSLAFLFRLVPPVLCKVDSLKLVLIVDVHFREALDLWVFDKHLSDQKVKGGKLFLHWVSKDVDVLNVRVCCIETFYLDKIWHLVPSEIDVL